ncbi:MAG: HprK-related kinase A [Sulfuriferula sp.]
MTEYLSIDRAQISGAGLALRTGPFVTHIRSPFALVAEGLAAMYPATWIGALQDFADFHVRLAPPLNLRRWWHPQVVFQFDGKQPFKPLPADQAYAMLEWGLNWCISAHMHRYLMLHAGVIERHGRAVILPAPPGSGKSTLTAGLIQRGWRLLSDELGIFDRGTGEFVALARPVSLKNQSIEVIRKFAPDAIIGRTVHDTVKGTVAHLRAPQDSFERVHERARPAWVVLPRYVPGSKARLEVLTKGEVLMAVAEGAFNYSLLGAAGFHALSALIDRCDCYQFEYSDLEQAAQVFHRLAEGQDV